MNCADVDRRFAEWLAGSLSEAEARALEAHAVGCDACGDRFEAATRQAALPGTLAPPPALRAEVLGAVAQLRARRRRAKWWATASGIAAVLFIALVSQPRRKQASDVDYGAAILFAMDRARPEFAALDAAERDLVAALKEAPADRGLAQALEDVRRHRTELQRLIREAKS